MLKFVFHHIIYSRHVSVGKKPFKPRKSSIYVYIRISLKAAVPNTWSISRTRACICDNLRVRKAMELAITRRDTSSITDDITWRAVHVNYTDDQTATV